MPSVSERSRNNVKAGVFVIVSIVLAMATIMVLTDALQRLLQPKESYTVTFDVSEGVKNVKKGSEVRVGGVLMGRVTEVVPDFAGSSALERISVLFDIDSRVALYKDAMIVVSAGLIGGDARLDIFSVGTPTSAGPTTDPIPGVSNPGILDTMLGPENAAKASEMVDRASNFVTSMEAAGEDVQALVHRVAQEDWPRWADGVDNVITWADTATGKLDAILEDGQGLFSESRALVTDNRPKIDRAVDNVDAAGGDIAALADRLRTQTVQKLEDLLDKGSTGLDDAVALIQGIGRDYDLWSPQIADAVASARIAAQQVELTMIEVRRSPWKLLYSPDRSEVAHEMLYEAARSFAMAASDMKAATASAQRLLDNHADRLDPESLQKLNTYLLEKVASFEKAQALLLDVLVSE